MPLPSPLLQRRAKATGITAAKAAGLRAIAVPNQYTAYQDFSRADARVERLDRVMALIA